MSEEKQRKRRSLLSILVEPYRQIQLGLAFVCVNLLFSLLILAVFSYYFWDVYNSMSLYFSLSNEQSTEILSKLLIPIYLSFALIFYFYSCNGIYIT